MIILSRSIIRQLRTVFRSALGRTSGRHAGPLVVFESSADRLVIRAAGADAAVEYQQVGRFTPAQFAVPLGTLAEFEGRNDTAVCFELASPTSLRVSWHNGLVPRNKFFELFQPPDDSFPPTPEHWLTVDPSLLPALEAAVETTGETSSRYAFGCLQLRGQTGEIVATDGCQLLVQGGFTFPWPHGNLLVPALDVFGCRDLGCKSTFQIGRSEKNVSVAAGPWTLHLRINEEGRYPQADDVMPSASTGIARLTLHAADAKFLLDTIERLPGDELLNHPVSFDLNGQVIVRARSEGDPRPTEVILRNSEVQGDPIRLHTNRKYLARAVRLGFRDFYFFGKSQPLLAQDERRRYVWMCLGADDVILPAVKALRIESPTVSQRYNRDNGSGQLQSAPEYAPTI